MNFKRIDRVPIKFRSGGPKPIPRHFKQLKRDQYTVIKGFTITGEAPKEFIRLYEYGKCRKAKIKTWPLYIAKTGHKWYPAESITEFMNNEIGRLLGFNMAACQLVIENEQLRFLSRYFTGKKEILEHGANIIAGYLDDEKFVKQVRKEGKEKELFTIETVKEAFDQLFPDHSEEIYCDFIKMLLFDAFIGINDRHHYNWGVLVDVKKRREPRFSPIYDSARSLFWNSPERKIKNWLANKGDLNKILRDYALGSKPKVGLDNKSDIDHFDLVKQIYDNDLCNFKKYIAQLYDESNFCRIISFINSTFAGKLSEERLAVISRYLCVRATLFQEKVLKTTKG